MDPAGQDHRWPIRYGLWPGSEIRYYKHINIIASEALTKRGAPQDFPVGVVRDSIQIAQYFRIGVWERVSKVDIVIVMLEADLE